MLGEVVSARAVLAGDGVVGARQGQVITASVEGEIGVEVAGGVGGVIARGEDHHELPGVQRLAGRLVAWAAEDMARKLLANTVIENYRVELLN